MYGKDSKEIYKRYLLSEISKKELENINYSKELSKLSFNNIFEGKYRVILPIVTDSTFQMILDKLQSCQAFKYDHFDFQKQKVVLELPVDEKFKHLVKGKKLREETLNTMITKMKEAECLTPQEAEEFTKWTIKYSGKGLQDMGGDLKVIILSRSPVDILRMSDVSGIDSCHGVGGRYYSCAIDEAKNDAGFVGFLVSPQELEKVPKEKIENDLEIFADKDRNIEGIHAFGRIRVRAIKIDGYPDPFGFTEPVIYGKSKSKNIGENIQYPGVFSTVRSFLKQKQSNLPSVDDLQKIGVGKMQLLGGSYSDSGSVNELLKNFYNTSKDFKGTEEYNDDYEAEPDEDQGEALYRELREIHQQSGIDNHEVYPHVSASFDANNDGEYAYYSVNGSVNIKLADYDVDISEFDDYYDHHSIQDRKQGNNTVGLFFKTLKKKITDDTVIDWNDISEIHFNYRNDTLYIYRGLAGGSETYGDDPDNYYTFTEDLKAWDIDYENILKAVLESFSKVGLYEFPMHEYDTADDINDEQFRYVHYDSEDDTNEGSIFLDGSQIFSSPLFAKEYNENKPNLNRFADTLAGGFSDYIRHYYKQPSGQVEVERHPEFSFESISLGLGRFQPLEFTITIDNKYKIPCSISNYDKFDVRFNFVTRNINFLKFIDEHYIDFLNIFKVNLITVMAPEIVTNLINDNNHFRMLLHVYKKYTDLPHFKTHI